MVVIFPHIASDKVLKDKAFNIAKNPKYDGYERGLASMVYKFLIKSLLCFQINLYQVVVLGSGVSIPLEFNKQLPKKIHKPIIRKF